MRDGEAGALGPRLTGMAALAAGLLCAIPSDAAWDGKQAMRLGDSVTAEFQAAPLLEVHDYRFWAPKGTVLSAQCVVDKTSPGLVPDMNLFTALEEPVSFGKAQIGTVVKNYTFAESGEFSLKLRATAGTGVYRLTTKPKFPKTVAGSETGGTFAFDALGGSLMSVQVKATKGSSASPSITGLTYLGGVVDLTPYTSKKKKGAKAGGPVTKLSKVLLPVNGTYTLAIDHGTAGQSVDVKIGIVAPRAGRIWAPGVVEDPVGQAGTQVDKWMASGHGDTRSEAFIHWNHDAAQVVPTSCAKCHSTSGYRDFLGDDGTAANVVNNAVPVSLGETVSCDACHNDTAAALTSVKFPSGTTVTGLGKEARCMVCHQGRESTSSVEAKIAAAAPGTVDDAMSVGASAVSFMNVHYFAAGATLYGTQAMGAYEYADPSKADPADYYAIQGTTLQPRLAYESKFKHVSGYDTCLECHDVHATQVKVTKCATCHVDAQGNAVTTLEDLRDIRMAGTTADFDGDGQMEGVYYEIEGMQAVLLKAIQDYTVAVFNKKIVWNAHSHPYFMLDDDGDGVADDTELTKFPNWSARLLRAAYNYQFSMKDPGAFAHNPKYVIAILYDSIADLNGRVPVANFANLVRNDSGHFDMTSMAWRDWDEDEIPSTPPAGGRGSTTGTDQKVNANCNRCHSYEGFQYIVDSGTQTTFTPAARVDGLQCESCHEDGANFSPNGTPALRYVARVNFPYQDTSVASTSGTPSTVQPSTQAQIAAVTIFNGAKGSAGEDASFVCMTCHRGRGSMLTLDAADVGGATVDFKLSTPSPHYLAAGAIQYGSKAAHAYQYAGKTYVQRYDHDQAYNQPYALASGVPVAAATKARCSYCHMEDGSHKFEVELGPNTTCGFCHPATVADDLTPFGRAQDNYDNDVNTKPKAETKVFADRLALAINNYSKAAKALGTTGAEWSLFNDGKTPGMPTSVGWYKDTDHSGTLEASEVTSSNAAKWDSKGFRATYNYRVWVNEPGAWAHNPRYILQILYDSAEDLDPTTVVGITRP